MPLKEWVIELGESRVYVWRQTHAGLMSAFAVVLMDWNGKAWECTTRYDCAHGFAHRDVLGRKAGLLYKQTFPGLALEEVFQYAIDDCKKNYEKHLRFFLSH